MSWLPQRRQPPPRGGQPRDPPAPQPPGDVPLVRWVAPRCPRCSSDSYRWRNTYAVKRRRYLACLGCGLHYVADEVGLQPAVKDALRRAFGEG